MTTRSTGTIDAKTPPPQSQLLRRLLDAGIVHPNDWDLLPRDRRDAITAAASDDTLLGALVGHQLITPFQLTRIRNNELTGLVLGNYRLLDKIGAGGMGVVFRAEHIKLRKPVAVKALFVDGDKNRRALDRFFNEVLAVTRLKHPHIVAAVDAGEQAGAGPHGSHVPYLVMEFINGQNLEDLVIRDGPMSIEKACLMAHQVADALTEAHRQQLIHRDLKPGNVLINTDGVAKLLDFGVARLPSQDDRMTKDGARLGTIGYMAPEQTRNAKLVDVRADVFGLGATVFFALTGRDPFEPPIGSAGAFNVPSARETRPDVPPELDAVLAKLMALNPADRVPTATEAMRVFMPFLKRYTQRPLPDTPPTNKHNASSDNANPLAPAGVPDAAPMPYKILVVDDQVDIRRVCKLAIAGDSSKCDEVGTGPDAVAKLKQHAYDLVLLDVDLPGLNGEQVLRAVRQNPPTPHIKVIMLSGRTSGDDLSRLMAAGADDFLTKPFSLVQLRSRVKAALKLKEAQDRSDGLQRHLMTSNAELEKALSMRDAELVHARGAMVLALAKLVEHRSAETGAHLIRLQRYCRILCESAAQVPMYSTRLTPEFIQALEDAAPLHDIGKTAVPDYILNKPSRLDAQERTLMEAHTVNGAETLLEVARRYRFATGFLHMASDVARYHHERWDGTGYPDRLSGEDIPLAARLLALCDVYDALRSRRVYKPPLSHNMALLTMLESSPGHFDPNLLTVFKEVADKFDEVIREYGD